MKKTVISRLFILVGIAAVISAAGSVWGQTTIEATETIRLYEKVAAGQRIPVVTCIDLEHAGRLLAIGGDDRFVRLWDVQNRRFVTELSEHNDWVRSLAFSSDQSRLATLGQDGQIRLWNVANGQLIRSLNNPVRGTQQIIFQPNGTQFAVCGFDKNIRVYDAATGNLVIALPAHGTNNRTITYSSDGSLLAAGGRTGVVRIWRTGNYQAGSVDIAGDGRRILAVAFSPDGTQLAAGGEGPFITLWSTADGKLVKALAERPGKTYSLTFCGNDTLASGESDNVIRLWNLAAGGQTATLSGHTGTISTMIFEPNTKQLITGSFDTSVRFWTLPTAEKQAESVSPFAF